MAEKLTVRNFAGIQDLEIEVKRINVLIGPQASGKSICAKLLFYFKNFVWQILAIAENEQTQSDLELGYAKTFEEYFPPESWGDADFFIRYEISDAFIEVSRKPKTKGEAELHYSQVFERQLKELQNLKQKSREDNSERLAQLYRGDDFNRALHISFIMESSSFFDNFGKTEIGPEFVFKQLFIPAGRSFFTILQNNIFSFLNSQNTLDPFLRQFGSVYENIKQTHQGRPLHVRSWRGLGIKLSKAQAVNATLETTIDQLIELLMCGKAIHEKGKDFLETVDGRRIDLAHSSSGQQEIFPLAMILAALPARVGVRDDQADYIGQTVYIEEPEAHLFPSAQRNIVDLISTVFNCRKDHLQFFITTHSPYILTSLNNLIQAGLAYQTLNGSGNSQIGEIVPDYKALNVSDLSAYVLAEGRGLSIICAETGLIDAQVIDAVSDDLAIEFDQLLNLV